jgi:hypothetical protein
MPLNPRVQQTKVVVDGVDFFCWSTWSSVSCAAFAKLSLVLISAARFYSGYLSFLLHCDGTAKPINDLLLSISTV